MRIAAPSLLLVSRERRSACPIRPPLRWSGSKRLHFLASDQKQESAKFFAVHFPGSLHQLRFKWETTCLLTVACERHRCGDQIAVPAVCDINLQRQLCGLVRKTNITNMNTFCLFTPCLFEVLRSTLQGRTSACWPRRTE